MTKKKTGWLLYESDSAAENKWFIEKLQKECKPYGLELKLVYTDYVSDAYDMNLNGLAGELLKSGKLPDFVVNRSRNATIAYSFEERGIRVFNPARVTEVANDKEKSYKVAETLGIPYMPFVTISEEDIFSMLGLEQTASSLRTNGTVPYDNASLNNTNKVPIRYISTGIEGIRSVSGTKGYNSIRNKADDFGYPFVLKPAEGHGGQHVFLINNEAELLNAVQGIMVDYHKHPYRKLLMQRLASVPGRDLRIYFIGGKIAVGMLRTAGNRNDFRANFSLGGNAAVHTPDREERFLAGELSEALPGDYMGVDFVFDRNGTPVFNEFEDVVGARMIYANTDIDMVRLFAHRIGSVLSE